MNVVYSNALIKYIQKTNALKLINLHYHFKILKIVVFVTHSFICNDYYLI
jgi:hypothetical protein